MVSNQEIKLDVNINYDLRLSHRFDLVNSNKVYQVTNLLDRLCEFLCEYQSVISPEAKLKLNVISKKSPYGFKQIILNQWINQAANYMKLNPTDAEKILGLLSFTDCCYNYPQNYLTNLDKYKYILDGTNVVNTANDERMEIEKAMEYMMMFDGNIINGTKLTEQIGLFNSSFYNHIMLELLREIILNLS